MSPRAAAQAANDARREHARHGDGTFGRQHHSTPDGDLGGPAGEEPLTASEERLAAQLELVAPDATRAVYEIAPHPFDRDRVLFIPEQIDHEDGRETTGAWNRQLNDSLPEEWRSGVESPIESEMREEFDADDRPSRIVLERAGGGWHREFEYGS